MKHFKSHKHTQIINRNYNGHLYIYYQLSPMNKFIVLCLILGCVVGFRFFDSSPFRRETTRFGYVRWVRNTPEMEEVIDEGESLNDGSDYKAAFDTILDVTQNPQRKQEFLECSKGKHAQFFKFGGSFVGYLGNHSTHESIVLERLPDDCF